MKQFTIYLGVLSKSGVGDYSELCTYDNLKVAIEQFEALKNQDELCDGYTIPPHGYVELVLFNELNEDDPIVMSEVLVDRR